MSASSSAFPFIQRALAAAITAGVVLLFRCTLAELLCLPNEWIVYDALYAYCQEMARRGDPKARSKRTHRSHLQEASIRMIARGPGNEVS